MGFTVEMGFIPPVWYTALKCRVPRLRRQAAAILRAAPHREGVWDRLLVSRIVDEIIKTEEGDFYAAGPIPSVDVGDFSGLSTRDLSMPRVGELHRISDVRVILPDDPTGNTVVKFRKRLENGEWTTCEKSFDTVPRRST
jgi:hypothetical protein